MFKKKYDLAIINRSFWPENEILGEAKLRMAELVAKNGKACVVTQAKTDIEAEAAQKNRGQGVKFYVAKSRSDSASGLIRRILDALMFGPYVFWSLCRARPRHVYVSTNPPVFVPFIVFLYCRLFKAQYTYHLQDIHPEITNFVIPMNKYLLRFLRGLDNITLRHAAKLVTLSYDMAEHLRRVSSTKAPIHLISNPAFDTANAAFDVTKTKDLVFCGNAGRVQRIPLLLEAIQNYLELGGTLEFTFIGGGVYAPEIEALAKRYKQVIYHGYIKASAANTLVAKHRWAILPIDDEVTKYAFPSKSSSYLASGCRILAICSKETAVARWVYEKQAGESVKAELTAVVQVFRDIEKGLKSGLVKVNNEAQTPVQFAERIMSVINS